MNRIYLLSILIIISTFSFSQSTSKIKYGLFAGVNISQIWVTVPELGTAWSPNKVGVNFGAMAELAISKLFSMQADLGYSSLGWKDEEPVYADSFSINNPVYNLNYLTLPVLMKFKLPATIRNGNGLAIYAGPQACYLVNAKVKGSDSNGSLGIKDGFSSFDFAGIGGAEYFMANGIGISVRYQFGLANIFSSETNDAFEEMYGSNAVVKNNATTITIGYRF